MKELQTERRQAPSLVARVRRGATGLRIGRPKARTAKAVGSFAIGSFALGAFASLAAYVGTVAIGRLAVGRLSLGKGRIKQLQIDELEIGKFRLIDQNVASAHNGEVVRPAEPVARA